MILSLFGRPSRDSQFAQLVSPYQIIPIRLGAVDSATHPAEWVVLLFGVTNSFPGPALTSLVVRTLDFLGEPSPCTLSPPGEGSVRVRLHGEGKEGGRREREGASVRPPVAVMLDEVPDEDVLPPMVACCMSCSLVDVLSSITSSIHFGFCQLVLMFVSLHPPLILSLSLFSVLSLSPFPASAHFPPPGSSFRLALLPPHPACPICDFYDKSGSETQLAVCVTHWFAPHSVRALSLLSIYCVRVFFDISSLWG